MTREELWVSTLNYRLSTGVDVFNAAYWADSLLAEFDARFSKSDTEEIDDATLENDLAGDDGHCCSCRFWHTIEHQRGVSRFCTNPATCTTVVGPRANFGCVYWEAE